MSYALSAIKQIRFPAISGPYGRFQIVINRPGYDELDQPAADTLLLSDYAPDSLNYSPYLLGEVELSKKKTTTRGRRALDDITIQIRDTEGYTGTVNGVDVSELFSPDFLTFTDVWFDQLIPYKAFVYWQDAKYGLIEVLQGGWIDPTYRPTSDPEVINVGTTEEYWLGTRTVKITKLQAQKTWQDVLNLCSASDVVDGVPYVGFMFRPPGCGGKSGSRAGFFSSSGGDWFQGVPHVHLNDPNSNPILVGLPAAVWPTTPFHPGGANQIVQTHYSSIHGNWPGSRGTGYAIGDTGTINGGTIPATYRITEIGDTNPTGVTEFEITFGGEGYTADDYSGIGSHHATTATSGAGTGFTVTVLKVSSGATYGPTGNNFIQLFHLFELIAQAQGFQAFDVTKFESALDFFAQKADNSAQNFPVDTTPLALTDLYVSFNLLAKCHPYDGSFWDNPIGFNPETPLSDVMTALCNLLLCDFNEEIADDGTSELVTTAFGTPGDALPVDFIPEGTPEEAEPNTGPRVAHVKNKNDDLVIACPAGVIGDAAETEILLRLHRIGNTSGGNPPTTPAGDMECFQLDANKKLEEQADECFKACWIDNSGVPSLNPNVWKSLCYLFWLDTSHTNVVYPSVWSPFPKRDGSAGSWNNSLYAVNACYKRGAVPQANLVAEPQGKDYFNSRCYHAVAFATLTLPLPTVRKYSYSGLCDSTGSVRNIKPGITDVRRYGMIATQGWAGDEIVQRLIEGSTEISWQAVDGTGFPNLTDKLYSSVKGDSTGSTSGGGSTGSGGVVIPTPSNWTVLNPPSLTVDTDNWNIGSTFPAIALVSSVNDLRLSGIANGKAGDWLVLHNVGTHYIGIFNDAYSAAPNRFKYPDDSLDLGPLGALWLWHDGSFWKILSVR